MLKTGFDGGEKVKGRKRTILVDTMGLLLDVKAHSARRSDHDVLTLLGFWFASIWGCLQLICTDTTFSGRRFVTWLEQTFGWSIAVIQRSAEQKGFQLLPRRWVVGQAFAWFGRYRRQSTDYEYLPSTSEAMLYAAMVNLMLRRLA